MVRPECYQCARCGVAWSTFYPRLVCRCGCDVLRRTSAALLARLQERAARIAAADAGDAGRVLLAGVLLVGPERADWSPYPLGNGTEGVADAG